MSLFHSIKRTVVKGKNITQDPVFDKLCAQFKDIEKQSLNMQMAMKDSFKAWSSVKKNILTAVDAANKAVGADELGQDVVQVAKRATDTISGEEVQSEGSLRTAYETLNEFIVFCRDTAAKRDKRITIAKDVDYYTGKLEELQAKGDKTPQEKITSATKKLEDCEAAYEAAHEECMVAMQKAVELKDEIIPRVLVAYLEAQNRMLNANTYEEIVDRHHSLLGAWPSIQDYEIKNQVAIQRVTSSRSQSERPNALSSTSSGSLNGAPRPAPRPRPPAPSTNNVKVLYDFDAESEQELPLKAGQYVTIVEEVDENWYRGKTADGKTGIFPRTYVE